MTVRISYELNGGQWAPKDEVKEAFYTDLYNFVNERYETELKKMSLRDFVASEPYIIGNTAGKYYLKEEVGGKIEDQPEELFIGYCYKNGKYLELIPHLIEFFANWRTIEGCMEAHAEDFFANSWASLVDTAKFFKYTTVEDLKKSPEAPSVQCDTILNSIQSCPGRYFAPEVVDSSVQQRLPKPKRDGYVFYNWYNNPEFNGEPVYYVDANASLDLTYYARWSTHTLFHSNDGYVTFDDLYTDFLNDFSSVVGEEVGKTFERVQGHGRVSEFVKASYDGKLNAFFANRTFHDKWWWLVDYVQSLKKDESVKALFDFNDGQFVSEPQVRWELNSLFVGWFHLVWPKTGDYSGPGIKERLADSTNTSIVKVEYIVNDLVQFPTLTREGYEFAGWYDNPQGEGEAITEINDDRFASKTLFAQWK